MFDSEAKRYLLVISIALLSAVFASGLTYLLLNSSNQTTGSTEQNNNTAVEESNETETQTPEMDSWKTYENEEYGVSFEYPSNLYLEEDSSQEYDYLKLYLDDEGFELPDGGFGGLGLPTPIVVQIDSLGNYQNKIDSMTDSFLEGTYQKENININGKEATLVWGNPTVFRNLNDLYGLVYVPLSNNRVATFQFLKSEADNLEISDFKEIISTFSFSNIPANLNNCPSDFSSYENEFFSICYPNELALESEDIGEISTGQTRVQVNFSSSNKNLSIMRPFQGGWGPSPCERTEDVQVEGYDATRHYWLAEGSPEECVPRIERFSSVFTTEDGISYFVNYLSDSEDIRDTYLKIEQSLNIK